MAARLTVAALLLLPWLHAWCALDRSDQTEELRSTLDLNGAVHPGCSTNWRQGYAVGGEMSLLGYDIYEVKSDAGEGLLKEIPPSLKNQGRRKQREEELEKEKKVMEVMTKANCFNTVRLLDGNPCIDGKSPSPDRFVMSKYATTLTDHMEHLEEKKIPGAKCFKHIFREVVKGVECMNRNGWVHMNIKAENVFLTYPNDFVNTGLMDCENVRVAVANYGKASPDQAPHQLLGGRNPHNQPPEIFGITTGLGLEWINAAVFLTHRKIDWCMLRILVGKMDHATRDTRNRLMNHTFLTDFPDIDRMPSDECKYSHP